MIRLILFLIVSTANADKIVQTNSGPIRGKTLDAKNVEAYLRIPYAEPPVGNLRFARPVSKAPWKETVNANELPPACVQATSELFIKFFNISIKMEEDCLYLNLWVSRSESILKPVMVHIHGGGFMVGSSSLSIYDGAALSQQGDIIVASMNYRVGTLGFFSGFIDEAAGSMGMYDQLLAIQWIKNNAKHFGGDPDNIVLFGESAGAFSISLHMVSPLSKNLFKRAILESGAGISPMYSDGNEMLRMGSQEISTLLGCAANDKELKENPKGVVECMKNLPPEKFSEVDSILFQKFATLVPRVGDEFLPINPTDLYRKGEFNDCEVLLGVTRDEGSVFVIFPLAIQNNDVFGETIDADAFNETSAKEMAQLFLKNEQSDEIIQTYFKKVEEESRYTYLNAISDVIGDSLITCGALFQADFQSLKGLSVYFYLFDYRSPSSAFPEWAGVAHCEEVQYVFGFPILRTFSEYEEELSKDMMDMWVAFARTG